MIRVPVWFVSYVWLPLFVLLAFKLFLDGRVGSGVFVVVCDLGVFWAVRKRGYYGGRREYPKKSNLYTPREPGGSKVACPRCGLINPPSAARCDCGFDLESPTEIGEDLADCFLHWFSANTFTVSLTMGR
jgi:hypothetical protein